MTVYPRNALCLHCRTALVADERCDIHPDPHAAASMHDLYGRESLVAAVWGSLTARNEQLRAADHAQRALGVISSLGAGAGILATLVVLPGLSEFCLIGGVLSGSLCWTLGQRAFASEHSQYPVGAEPLPESMGHGIGIRGEVEGELAALAPASGTECMGYGIELRLVSITGERVMFRDAVTTGFDVLTDEGRLARVPPGRIRLFGKMLQQVDIENKLLSSYLRDFDPHHDPDNVFDPLQFHVVYEQLLLPGDRIELLSVFEPTVSPGAALTHYRQAAPSILMPRGVPVLHLLP